MKFHGGVRGERWRAAASANRAAPIYQSPCGARVAEDTRLNAASDRSSAAPTMTTRTSRSRALAAVGMHERGRTHRCWVVAQRKRATGLPPTYDAAARPVATCTPRDEKAASLTTRSICGLVLLHTRVPRWAWFDERVDRSSCSYEIVCLITLLTRAPRAVSLCTTAAAAAADGSVVGGGDGVWWPEPARP